MQTNKQKSKQRQTGYLCLLCLHVCKHAQKKLFKQTLKQTYKHLIKYTNKHTNKQTETNTQTYKQTFKQTHKLSLLFYKIKAFLYILRTTYICFISDYYWFGEMIIKFI